MQKKIAVCFSGYPRFVEESFNSIKSNFLGNLGDFEIFADFQWSENILGKKIHHEFDLIFDKNEPKIFEDLYSVYKINKISIREPFVYDTSWLTKLSGELDSSIDLEKSKEILYRLKSQYEGIKNCVNGIEPLDDYSHVIRMRTDLIFNKKLYPSDFISDSIINQDGFCAGSDRKFSDWFFSCPVGSLSFFDELANLEKYFSNGVLHMHNLIAEIGRNFSIDARSLQIDTPNTHQTIKRFYNK